MASYVFDTNSFGVLESYYPDRFPTFWSNFDAAIASKEVISVREVYNELQHRTRTNWLPQWVEINKSIFLKASAAEMQFVARIFQVPHFRTLVGKEQQLKGSAVADPFIIACASVQGACVVTEEAFKPNAAKIPNVCKHFDVTCTDVNGFLNLMGWSF